MLTTLMMLLGLSGTGADLKEIAGSEGGTRPDGNLSPRQRRRQKQKQAEEFGPSQPKANPSKPDRPTKGGRGQELNFQTDPKEPKSKPKPLSEKLSELDTDSEEEIGESGSVSSGKEPKSARSGRREKQKPPKSLSDLPLGEFGEESSESSSSGERPKREKPDISFSADDIISKNSKYSFHRRPLLNAEALVEAEQVEEAIEIFERTGNRIPDQEIKEKIKKNIQDLEEFLEDNPQSGKVEEPGKGDQPKADSAAKEKPKKKEPKSSVTKPDKDLTDLVSALKEVSELFAESIARAIQFAQNSPPPTFPQVPGPPPQNLGQSPGLSSVLPPPPLPPNTVEMAPQGGKGVSPAQSPISSPQVNQNVTGGNQLVHPIVYQFLQSSPQTPGFDPKAIQNQDQLLQSLNQGLTTGGLAGAAPGFPMAPPGSGIVGPFYVPQDLQGQPGIPGIPGGSGSPGYPSGPNQPLDLQMLADQISKKDVSELDLPEDTFFSSDWKQFKDLPLVDRRSGEERRKNPDRRTNIAGRKDRRSGEDRRKKDRFQEREDFLKNQALKKIEKKAKELEAKGEETSLNDLLKPYFPDQPGFKLPEDWSLEPINLPDPNDLRRDEKEPPLHPQERPLEEEPNWLETTTDALRKELELPDPVDPQTDQLIKPKPEPKEPTDSNKSETIIETDLPIQVELTNRPLTSEDLKIGLPDADEVFRERKRREEAGLPEEEEGPSFEDAEAPEIEIVDGNLGEIAEEESPIPLDEMAEKATEEEPEKIIHGVLELKPPEADDAPFLTLTYDFGKIPHAFRLSKNYSIMEYSYYKYKPMLMKAQEFARRKMLKNALNYYRVIKSQNIPPELRKMINRNIRDITEFMEKFLMAKGN